VGGVAPDVDRPASTSGRAPVWWALLAFAGISAVLTAVVTIGSTTAGPTLPYLDGPVWLDGWSEGDSGWYYGIATYGYFYNPGEQSSIAFFPSYPLAVRGVGDLIGGDYQIAGSLIGVLAGAAAVVLFAQWVWQRLPRGGAITAIAVMMVYPYAFFLYGAMYSDSLFLLTAVGAFVLLERRYYWLAGLVGVVATAGRPVGVAVAIGLVIRMLEMRAEATLAARPVEYSADPTDKALPDDPDKKTPVVEPPRRTFRPGWRDLLRSVPAVRWREAGVLVSGLGLAAWCVYLWIQFGDPVAFATVQEAPGWYQRGGPHTWFKVVYIGTMVFGPVDVAIRLTAQAIMCLLAILLLPRVWRLFGWGYLAYSFVVLAIPIIGTKDFMGTGRYVLAAFPVIAAAGDFLVTRQRGWIRPVVLILLAAGLVVATAVFSMGVAVS